MKRKQPEYQLHSKCVSWLRENYSTAITVHADGTGGGPWKGASGKKEKTYTHPHTTHKHITQTNTHTTYTNTTHKPTHTFPPPNTHNSEKKGKDGLHQGHSRPARLPTRTTSHRDRIQGQGKGTYHKKQSLLYSSSPFPSPNFLIRGNTRRRNKQ